MWKAKATSKTQQLILIYKELNIYFISSTSFLLSTVKSPKFFSQPSKGMLQKKGT